MELRGARSGHAPRPHTLLGRTYW